MVDGNAICQIWKCKNLRSFTCTSDVGDICSDMFFLSTEVQFEIIPGPQGDQSGKSSNCVRQMGLQK